MITKSGFSFIEILVSVILLFIGLLALLKFDSFVKHDIEKNVNKHKILMLSSGYNLSSIEGTKSLDTLFKFPSLRDDEKKFLKETEIVVKKLHSDDFIVYSGGDFHYELEIQTMKYSNNDNEIIFYKVSP